MVHPAYVQLDVHANTQLADIDKNRVAHWMRAWGRLPDGWK